jgi:ribonuclease-3
VQLNQFLLVGKGVGGRESVPSSLLANAFEAVLGAVFLDLGMDAARDFALRVLEEDVQEVLRDRHEPNYKSVLQHYAQKNMNATPTYRVRQEVGPDHLKSFTVVALLNGVEHGIGTGSTKKEAEQSAAAETLRQLGVAPPDDAGPPAAHGPQF